MRTGLVENTLLRQDLTYSHSENKFKYKVDSVLTFGIIRKFLLKAKQDVKPISTPDLRTKTNSNTSHPSTYNTIRDSSD